MTSGRNQFKETLSNCFGVIKSSPPLLSVLIYASFYISFMISLFALIGFSVGEETLNILLMAGMQTAIAVPGYLYMMWNEPKYLLLFALSQLAAFSTEFVWKIILFSGTGFSSRSALLMLLTILQLSNVIVAFFFRDIRVDFCCCGKNRSASGQTSVSLENGLTPPPANWAKIKQATPEPPTTTDKITSKRDKKPRNSSIKNALRRKKKTVDFDVEKNKSKSGTADSPLEKNIFGGISEEEKERAVQKRLSRMPVHTPSRSMTKTPDEVKVGPSSSSDRSKSSPIVVQQKSCKMTTTKTDSKSGSKERTSSESLRKVSVTIK